MLKRALIIVSVLTGLIFTGCTSDEEGHLLTRTADAWNVAAQPRLVVGTEASVPGGVLDLVRDAAQLTDGRVVVANGGLSSRLPMYSAQGEYLGSVGREGEGPGEFRWITKVETGPHDSLFVFDASLQRMTVFLPDGEVARTASFVPVGDVRGSGLQSVTRMADGQTWVGRGRSRIRAGPANVILRDTVSIGLLDTTFSEFRVLQDLPDQMMTTTEIGGRRAFRSPAFSPAVVHAVWGRCIFLSKGDDSSISVFGAEGSVVAGFEGPGVPRPVAARHLEVREEALLRAAPEDAGPFVRRMFRDEAKTTHLPYYHAMIADEWGQIWLQKYTPPWGMGRSWYVISQSGDWLGEVEMPKVLTVFSITQDGVLAGARGEFDEETVELFPWTRLPVEMADPLPECVVPAR